jgi:thioredoxin-like negative regulator of GroEL
MQPLAKSLGIKAVPTFKLFKNKEQVHEIQGAKYDALIEAIEKYI